MKFLNALVAAAVLSALAAAPALAAPTVSIRIEGEQRTLVPRTEVTLDPAQIPGVNDSCPGDTVAGAIDKGTEGKWDHDTYTRTILGERHDFSRNDAWSGWLVNTGKLTGGFCSTKLQEGDDVVVQANFADPNTFEWVYRPLVLRDVPANVEPGEPFVVRVEEIVPGKDQYGYEQPDSGTFQPAGDVSVAAGDVAGRTDSAGRVELRLDEPGDYAVQARSGAGLDRSLPVPIRAVGPGSPPLPPAPRCATTGDDGRCGTRDLQAPTALIESIREGSVFRRGRGPRELSGTAGVLGASRLLPDGTGILMIKLRLTRIAGGRCSTWSPTKERFVSRRCGAANGFWFRIATTPDWEYLLPERLRRGRYVLDADAIDRAGNRLRERRRGENRVVFRVR
jgi:hypothetical protein